LTTDDSSLNLFGTTFSGNEYDESHMPFNGVSDISNTAEAIIEVFSTCPGEGFASTAVKGAILQGSITSEIANAFSYSCSQCPSGSYRTHSDGDCVMCPSGTTNSGANAASQIDCPTTCQPGKYANIVGGASLCTDCDSAAFIKKYSSEWGALSCNDCPSPAFTAQPERRQSVLVRLQYLVASYVSRGNTGAFPILCLTVSVAPKGSSAIQACLEVTIFKTARNALLESSEKRETV
jgi:hypothetical protein